MQRRPSLVPDLFHLKRTTSTRPSSSIHVEICGTYTVEDAAQAAGLKRLAHEGYPRTHWSEYFENDFSNPRESWPYDVNVLVHARRGDEIHEVAMEITPNSLGIRAKPGDGRVEDSLVYVLHTVVDGRGEARTEIRGIHLSKQAAVMAARQELVGHEQSRESYREYEEVASAGLRDDDDTGELVVVRATGQDGEKYTVSVMHES